MSEKKRGRGRPSQDKMMRPYTLDRKIVEFVDSLPDGDRSRFVNRLLLQGTEIEKLAGKYYTYVLLRPDGSVFYVGKGQGNRIDQHEIEARKGVESHKCNVIRKIWEEGGEVIKQKVAFFDNEEDAYQLEILLITFFGRDNLTNATNGGERGTILKPGQLGRIAWTQVLSGDNLVGFVQYLGLEPDTMTKEELRDRVAEEGRKVFESALMRLLEEQHGSTTINQ